MKDKGTYNIEKLYRVKLSERKVPVRESFWSDFTGKLRFREFLTFRPGSFNIYYLAGLVVAATVTLSIISGHNGNYPDSNPEILNDTVQLPVQNDGTGGRDLISEPDDKQVNYQGKETEINSRLSYTKTGTDKNEEPCFSGDLAVNEEAVIKSVRSVTLVNKDSSSAKEIVSLPMPVARFSANITRGCAPLTISFNNLSLNYDSCIWEFDDGGLSTDVSPVWVYDEAGNYTVSLILFGKNDSRIVARETVYVYPRPVARFEVSEGNPYIPDEEVRFYNYSQNTVKWEWDFGDGDTSDEFEPSHFYDKPGSYSVKLKVFSEFGCADSMIITNAFADNSCYINFPNVFVPNEGGPTGGFYSSRTDMQEEVFHPVWSGITSYNLRIFSKRGVLIFETNDIDIGWDGYYKGQKVEPGVYVWKVRGTFKNGEPFVKGGDVTVLPGW